jgi:four helix bundle protein
MVAKSVEELSAPSFNRDLRLREQLASSSASVAALIAEGFEQSTDRFFAQYLYRSRGSSREVRTQLVVACQRRHIDDAERAALGEVRGIAKMSTGLIRHLEAEDRRHRRKTRTGD